MKFNQIKQFDQFPTYGEDDFNEFRDWLIDEIITEVEDCDRKEVGYTAAALATWIAGRLKIQIHRDEETAWSSQIRVLVPIALERRRMTRDEQKGQYSLKF
ncbi:hypothetical protein HNV11_23800 (plasmid) [Spirosoma taeanense]|uniref:Uncharacterized protein n=1 Tax=Spirosoma taeanense TaxID=2735870 RepID=A0A6M5YES6_9BACT|nr:hypothetical protein [Spirosoma taeanense]QJW92499.1 hypothetical protein HNV11_23800 [Spirosoma taeanense]